MDFHLRCNSLTCRVDLTERAVVTTCSHIFCIPCSQALHLSSGAGDRTCPACNTNLPNPDDAVSTRLNPTEEYKTSVLSGLSPSIIMDCASRGMSFWTYQTTQEIVFEEHVARMLREKLNDANAQAEKAANDSKAEIAVLKHKLEAMKITQQALEKNTHELSDALREKTRKHSQMQELYNRLKRRTLYAQVRSAAADAVDETLRSEVGSRQVGIDEREDVAAVESLGAGGHAPALDVDGPLRGEPRAMRQPHVYPRGSDVNAGLADSLPRPVARPEPNRGGVALPASRYGPATTPDWHRQPLPAPGYRGDPADTSRPPQSRSNAHPPLRRPSRRQPWTGASANVAGGSALAGYGMSAGIKTGRPPMTASSPNGPNVGSMRTQPGLPGR